MTIDTSKSPTASRFRRYVLGGSPACDITPENRRGYRIVRAGERSIANPTLGPAAQPRAEPVPPREEWACRIHEFREYIDDLSKPSDDDPLISTGLARTALKVWWKLYGSCSGDLSVPDVGPGHGGELIFIWKRNDHYLSVEIAPGGPAETFYRNRRTGGIWAMDFDPSDREVPPLIVEKLSFFLDND
jgi:hypothetical protein